MRHQPRQHHLHLFTGQDRAYADDPGLSGGCRLAGVLGSRAGLTRVRWPRLTGLRWQLGSGRHGNDAPSVRLGGVSQKYLGYPTWNNHCL